MSRSWLGVLALVLGFFVASSVAAHGFEPEVVRVTRIGQADPSPPARYLLNRASPTEGVELSWPQGCVADPAGGELRCQRGLFGVVPAAGLSETGRQVLLRKEDHGVVETRLLTADAPAATFDAVASRGRGLLAHGRVGLWHVLTGADHVLFLVVLVLVVRRLKPLLIAVTAFTAAHCVSVISGVLGGTLPQAPVEFAIAGSIVVLALAIVRQEPSSLTRRPWAAAAIFGLVHGLAFAGVLRDLQVPRDELSVALLGFNLGVEAGQIVVVMVVTLALWAATRAGGSRRGADLIAAYGVGSAGVFWGIQRAAALLGGAG